MAIDAGVYVAPVTIDAYPPLRVAAEVNATGLLCEVALISSLTFSAPATIEFSFTLPYTEPKYDAVLACFNTPRMALPLDGVTVASAKESVQGGSPVDISADLLPTVDTLTIPDALAGDPYFTDSYWQTRYDDFPRNDRRLSGDFVRWNGGAATPYERGAADNCVMLSAEWHSNRVYTIGLSYPNPGPPAAGETPGRIGLWIAPLTGGTSLVDETGTEEFADETTWTYAIRGHKYGTVCGAGTCAVTAGGTNTGCAGATTSAICTAASTGTCAVTASGTNADCAAALTAAACTAATSSGGGGSAVNDCVFTATVTCTYVPGIYTVASQIAATCTGTASDGLTICDLDAATDGYAGCAAGCISNAAYVPACDLDAATDGTGDCPAGCAEVVSFTPTCDLENSTRSNVGTHNSTCANGCTDTPAFTPICDLDPSTDVTIPGLFTAATGTCVSTAPGDDSGAADFDACAAVMALDTNTACVAVMMDCASGSTGSCPAGCTDSAGACSGTSTDLACTHTLTGSCAAGCLDIGALATCVYVEGTYSDTKSCVGQGLIAVTPNMCTGTATGADIGKICDLDASTDGSAGCPAGCTLTVATYPDCEAVFTQRAARGGDWTAAACPVGCTYSATDSDLLVTGTSVPDFVDVAESCTATMVSYVKSNDTSLCVLAETSDFGITNGTCTSTGLTATWVGGPARTIGTCEYVEGSFSTMMSIDTIDLADSCTSTLTVGPTDTFISNGTKCTICSNGTEPDFNRSACLTCPVGWVTPVGERCRVCPDGQEPDVSNAYCQDCVPGYAGRDGVCTLCPFGDMPNGDQTNGDLPGGDSHFCVDCPAGHAANAWQSGRCFQCAEGHWPRDNQTRCEKCPPGRSGTLGFCYDCPSGAKENGNSSACMPCPEGQAGLDGFCATCADGYRPNNYADEDRTMFHVRAIAMANEHTLSIPVYTPTIPEYTPTSSSRRTSADEQLTTCIQCPSGQAGIDGFCSPCGQGQEPRGNFTYCGNCTYDMVSTGHECHTCELGMFVDSEQFECLHCTAGLYSSEELPYGEGARERVNMTNCSYFPAGETCVVDPCTGYTQGTTGVPSTTCPSGCTLVGDGALTTVTASDTTLCTLTSGDSDLDTTTPGSCAAVGATATCAYVAGVYSALPYQRDSCTSTLVPETCTATVSDCVNNYVAGSATTPSTTCPTGCLQTNEEAKCEYTRTSSHQGIFCEKCAAGYEPETQFASSTCIMCEEYGRAYHSLNGSECVRCGPGFEPNADRTGCSPCIPGWAGSDGTCGKCPAGSQPIGRTCTGKSIEIDSSCTGTATTIAATCVGDADEMPATCTGTAFLNVAVCDLDPVTDGTAACANGCSQTAAYIPTCDFDIMTPPAMVAACPVGCNESFTYTPTCDLKYDTVVTLISSELTCATAVVSACAAAIVDRATCTAAGACTFTAGTPNTCVTTVVLACAGAAADQATCEGATATCTLPQAAVDACVAIGNAGTNPGDDCNADATCTWDGTGSTCGTTTAASACIAEAANGTGACAGVTGCAYDAGACAFTAVTVVFNSTACPAGCDDQTAYFPTCDLAAGTDGTDECPAGCDTGLARSSCVSCEATYAGTDGFCYECADGKMPNPTQTACIRCPINYAGQEGECEKCNDAKEPNFDQTECQPCHYNAAGVDGYCNRCPSGHAPSAQGNSQAPTQTVCESCLINAAGIDGNCSTCGDGEQADELRINCVDCPPGSAGYAGICVACVRGQEPNPERTVCLDCGPSMVSPTGIRCEYCDPGYETDSLQTQCLECESGKYSNAGPPWNQPRCSICEAGSQPSSVQVASGCTDCISLGKGYFSGAGQWCDVAPAGTEPNSDQTGYDFCWSGSIRAGTPVEMSDVMCEMCPDGKNAWARQSCEMCGTNEQGRKGLCTTCPDGKQPSPSHTQCDTCPNGYAGVNGRCYQCEDAEFPSEDLTGCEWCPIGSRGNDGECYPCLSGSQPSIDRGGNEQVIWRHGTMCNHCSAGRAGVDGVCGFCDPGNMPSPDRTVCLPCLPNSYSTNGANCSTCPLNTDTRNLGTKVSRFDCKCAASTYDAVITTGMLECFNEKGQVTETVDPQVSSATDCYACPSCYDCSSSADNTNPIPSVGYWRRTEADKQLIRCSRDIATSPCLGGPGVDGGATPCKQGYTGLICGSCELGFEPNTGDGTCQTCPARATSIIWTAISFCVLFGVAGTMIRKTRECAKPPTIDNVLNPGQNDLEVIVQCVRIMLAFLQVQALIGSMALNWPQQLMVMFNYGSMPADPYFIAQSAYCLRTMAGEDWVFMRAFTIMSLPFMVVALIATWYAWLHFTSLGCKADPSLTYIAEIQDDMNGGALGDMDQDGDGKLSNEEVMKLTDKDHDGKVSKDEFKEFFDKHKEHHVPKRERLTADAIILVFIIYPSIVRETFMLFSCELRGPGLWLLSADIGVECYSAKHSLWMTFVGIPGICFFCGLLPVMAITKIKRLQMSALLEDVQMVAKYGFLYRGYEEDYCYWEIIVTARKVGIVFIVVFFKSYGAVVQGIAALLVIQTALLLNVVYGPYDFGLQDRIETLSLSTSFFTLLGGLYFENNRDRGGGEDQVTLVSFVVETAVSVLNATVIIAMVLIVLKPIVHKIQQKKYCSPTRFLKNMYPRAFYWQPETEAVGKVVPITGVDRNEAAMINELGTYISATERREHNKVRLQAKQHSNEEAAHVLHQLEGALKGMQKYMPELSYELHDMLRMTDRVSDIVGERTRLTRDVAEASNIALDPPLMYAKNEMIVSEEIIPTVPHGHEERVQLMFKATVNNDVTVLQDLFDEDAIYLDVENRGGQSVIEVAHARKCHEAYQFLKRCENGLNEKSLKWAHEHERVERDKHHVTVDEYIVHVYTADQRRAGTDSNVFINLVGERAQTGMTPLRSRWGNSFERGKIDEFMVESNLGGLGEMRGVVVTMDSTGLSSNWLLEKVVVTPPDLPNGTRPLPVAFRADRWLGKSKGEGDTEQERCTAELFPVAGQAKASAISTKVEEKEPEPLPEFHIPGELQHKKHLEHHSAMRAQLAQSGRHDDAEERALLAEEQAEHDAEEMAAQLQADLPVTPPTEGEESGLPGMVGAEGAGAVEDYVDSDEEGFQQAPAQNRLLELDDATVAFQSRR